MKSILVSVFFGLILSTTVQAADCHDDTDRTLTWKNGKKSVEWEIRNKTKNEIVITRLGVWASDNKTVIKADTREHYIKPFGIKIVKVWFDDVNMDVRGKFFSSCRYGKPSKTSYKKKQTYKKKQKSWSQKILDKIKGN